MRLNEVRVTSVVVGLLVLKPITLVDGIKTNVCWVQDVKVDEKSAILKAGRVCRDPIRKCYSYQAPNL